MFFLIYIMFCLMCVVFGNGECRSALVLIMLCVLVDKIITKTLFVMPVLLILVL